MLNHIVIMGRLTRDPELRYTQSQTPVASFTVAVDLVIREDEPEIPCKWTSLVEIHISGTGGFQWHQEGYTQSIGIFLKEMRLSGKSDNESDRQRNMLPRERTACAGFAEEHV